MRGKIEVRKRREKEEKNETEESDRKGGKRVEGEWGRGGNREICSQDLIICMCMICEN